MNMPTAARRVCLAAIACLALMPESARAQPASEEAAAALPVVGGIKWVGQRALSKSQLQAVTFTRPPTWRFWKPDPEFSESTLIGDLSRITALYQVHGFYEARPSYTLVWNRAETRVAITIEIDEGLPVRVVSLELELPDQIEPVEREALLVGLPLTPEGIFSSNGYTQAKQDLLDRMAERGYPLAEISGGATVDVSSHQASVRWRLHVGPPVYFGDIEISGLYLVDEPTARREVGLRPGQRYSTSALAETRRRLQRQGLYGWVTVQAQPSRAEAPIGPEEEPAPATAEGESIAEPEPAPPAERPVVWPVEIRVTERSPYTIDAGIGYSSDESYRASLGWRNGNFFGDARKFRLGGLYSGILSKIEAEFTQPYLVDPKLSMVLKTALRHETEPAYTADRLVTSIGLSRPITGPWVGRITYQYSLHDVTRASNAANVILTEPVGISNVSRLELGLRRQTLDDLLVPTTGTWLDFVVAPSLNELGSDFDYITYLFEARGFMSVMWDSVIGARFVIGAIQPIRGTTAASVPVVSRFFSGGSNSFRGFRYHRMPTNNNIFLTEVGGTSLLEASLEWRFPIWRKLGGVVFLDAGQLDLEPFHYPLDQLYWAVGPGVRYDTIVGPLRFDFGILLNRPALSDDSFQWFISVGHSF